MSKVSVLIVDDEPLLLKGLSSIIIKTNPNFTIAGTAYDGKEALEKIEKLNPQVVFTDIRMPGMDGLTFLSLAKKHSRNFIPVIISGHDEFEYARKSIQLGVVEYLLKPVKLASLKTLLENLYNKVRLNQFQRQEELLNLLKFGPVDEKEINSHFGNYSSFSCVLICAGSYNNVKVKPETPSWSFWEENNLKEIIEYTIKPEYDYWVLDLEYGNQKMVVFAKEDPFTQEDLINQNSLYDKLSELHFPITYVFGSPFTNLQNLCNQIHHMQQLLVKNCIFGKSIKIDSDLPDKNNHKINQSYFEKLLKNNQFSLFIQHSLNYIKSLEGQSCLQINLETICRQLITMFYNKLLDSNKILDSKKIFFSDIMLKISEAICCSINYDQLVDKLSGIFFELLGTNNDLLLHNADHQQIANSIQNYIENNYYKQISLGTLSNIYGLVPPYLSKIFSTYKGISPIDYLTNIRIREAKKLLLSSPTILLKDVAQLVGYDDPYNFSKVFKRITGISPSEYRNNQTVKQ
ncbi:MAG TPA: response regulator [Clostridiaceae bacterium]|nr:response regulator [Clostridiaceae bacterium]